MKARIAELEHELEHQKAWASALEKAANDKLAHWQKREEAATKRAERAEAERDKLKREMPTLFRRPANCALCGLGLFCTNKGCRPMAGMSDATATKESDGDSHLRDMRATEDRPTVLRQRAIRLR